MEKKAAVRVDTRLSPIRKNKPLFMRTTLSQFLDPDLGLPENSPVVFYPPRRIFHIMSKIHMAAVQPKSLISTPGLFRVQQYLGPKRILHGIQLFHQQLIVHAHERHARHHDRAVKLFAQKRPKKKARPRSLRAIKRD